MQIEEFGGPEVLQVVDLPRPEPGDGEVLIEVSRAGMNFADTHQRENSYLAPYEVPLVLGGEMAGTTPDGTRVIALSAGVTPSLRIGLPMCKCRSHGTFLHFSLQSSHLNICYYHQDLH